jgi:DNA polymerase-4
VAERLAHHDLRARTIMLKLRYADFTTITRQASRAEPTDDAEEIRAAAEALLAKTARPEDRFRLIGIQCGGLAGREQRGPIALRML